VRFPSGLLREMWTMKKCLLPLVAAVLVAGASRAADDPLGATPGVQLGPPTPTPGMSQADSDLLAATARAAWEYAAPTARAAKLLRGRWVGGLVRKGMTTEDVEQVLGKGSKPLPSVGIAGGVLFGSMPYHDLGLWVEYFGDEAGVLRVEAVHYWPLFIGRGR
jgi:hypothetical protein